MAEESELAARHRAAYDDLVSLLYYQHYPRSLKISGADAPDIQIKRFRRRRKSFRWFGWLRPS